MKFELTFPLRYAMNLARRQDRRVDLEEQFENHELVVNRFPAVDGKCVRNFRGYEKASRYAVALTKRLIVRRAKLLGAETVFFFEDDVVLHPCWRERLAEIELPSDWGVFLLGATHQLRPKVVAPGLVKATFTHDNQAIGIRAEYFERILKIWKPASRRTPGRKTFSDIQLAQHYHEIPTYAAYPNLAWQANVKSDQTGEKSSPYSNYGAQKTARDVVEGLGGEMLGVKAYAGFPRSEVGDVAWTFSQGTQRELKAVGVGKYLERIVQVKVPDGGAGVGIVIWGGGNERVWEEYACGGGLQPPSRGALGEEGRLDNKGCVMANGRDAHATLQDMLSLLREAYEEGHDYMVLVPGNAVPLMPLAQLTRMLKFDGRSWIGWRSLEEVAEDPRKLGAWPWLAPAVEAGSWLFHEPWVVLNRECAGLILEHDLTEYFKDVPHPEECYFGTVLRLRGYPVAELCARKCPVVVKRDRVTGDVIPLGSCSRLEAGNLLLAGQAFAGPLSQSSNLGSWQLHREGYGGGKS